MTPELPRLLDTELDDYALDALRSARRDRGSNEALERVLTVVSPLIGAAAAPPPDLALPSTALKASATWAAVKGLAFGVFIGSACLSVVTAIEVNSNSPAQRLGGAPAPRSRSGASLLQRPAPLAEVRSQVLRAMDEASPAQVEPTSETPNGSRGEPKNQRVGKPELWQRLESHGAERLLHRAGVPAVPASGEAAARADEQGVSRAAHSSGSVPVHDAAPASELSREVRLVDEARRELASGNATAALAALDRREREVSARALDPEASLVRVEALFASGQSARAADLAKRTLAAHPKGPSAARLRQLLTQFP